MLNNILLFTKRFFYGVHLLSFIITVNLIVPSISCALIGLKEGDAPKEIILNDLENRRVTVSEFYGKKPVIIIFWEQPLSTAFLDYSMDALHFLSDYYEKYRDETGLEVFGVYTPVEDGEIPEEEIRKVRNLIKTNNITFPILIDQGFTFFQEFGVIALPTTVMVNTTGKVQFIYPSFPLAAHPLMAEQVKMLMGMAVPAKKEEAMKGPDSMSGRLYHYALQMYKKGLAEQSLSPLKKSLELDPDMTMSHNLLGVALWKSGKSDQAREAFAKAIELDRNNMAAHLNHCVLLYEQEHYADVENTLKSLSVADAPLKVRMHYLLGLVYWNTTRIDESIQELEEAINILDTLGSEESRSVLFSDSYRIYLLRDLASLYSIKNNQDKTIELLKRAVQVSLDLEGASDTIPLHERKDMMLYE
ncbi:MAG: tetratricopeptide repeat protein [Nitrospiraceae bacterium]|nr:MAG: tetratricopeptide repeat protein [Nitrospiraceae bacterium]